MQCPINLEGWYLEGGFGDGSLDGLYWSLVCAMRQTRFVCDTLLQLHCMYHTLQTGINQTSKSGIFKNHPPLLSDFHVGCIWNCYIPLESTGLADFKDI